ncbi:unnamed protein product [Chilo suppressalis]|uniref:Uncharacterized protein n=1 Tax=Chilo suppressalis TaxID=168631 RepID=A0ABN8BFU7_CHISP|nr:unnamed protein product [Chilo suppressalis]
MQRNITLEMQVENISLETVLMVQKDFDASEVISIIFLLDENHGRALENLIAFQRMSKTGSYSANILLDWAIEASERLTWKWEFVDALLTCQILSVIKKIGVSIPALKNHLLSSQRRYVHPIKKHIFKICENIDSIIYLKLIKILREDYKIILTDHENCEILFLQLMYKKFFTISLGNYSNVDDSVDKIVNVLDQIQTLRELSTEMKYLFAINNIDRKNESYTQKSNFEHRENREKTYEEQELGADDFDDTYKLLNQLTLEDLNSHFKADNGKK